MVNIFKLFFQYLNSIKIKKQLLLTYLVAAFIPVLLLGSYLVSSTRNLVLQQQISDAKSENIRIENSLKQLIDVVYNISNSIYFDNEVSHIISSEYPDIISFTNTIRDYSQLDTFIIYYGEISNIKIYVENDTIYDSSHYAQITDSVKDTTWYKKAADDWNVFWMTTADKDGLETLSLIRRIPTENGSKAILMINVNRYYLSGLVKDEPQKTIASTDDGLIFLSNSSDDLGKPMEYKIPANSKNDVAYIKANNKKVLSIFKVLEPETSNDTISIVTVNDEALNRANHVTFICCLLMFLCLIVPFLMIMYFSTVFSRRINLLKSEMGRVAAGNLGMPLNPGGKDEISELYTDLNVMIDGIKNLLNEVYMEKLMKERIINSQQKIEFKMLANQINPHFLYNTLETIRMKLICNGDRETANVIKILGKTMRRMLAVKEEAVTLSSELEYIRYYLDIQRFRFGNRINYEIKVDETINTDKYYLLPLLLQPVVENAFVHGLEDKKGGGKIDVIISEVLGKLRVIIQDNGIGMPPEKCEELNKSIHNMGIESIGNSIGLCNVHHRIVLYYGREYGINVESEPNVGTKVYITLPLNTEGRIERGRTDN